MSCDKEKNANKLNYFLIESKREIQYGECCYEKGELVWVHKDDLHCFCDVVKPAKTKECFPEYCTYGANGAWPVASYTNSYCLEPNVPVVATVPVPEGCSPPNYADFDICGGCLWVDYNTPVVLPAPEAPIEMGLAPEMNPTMRYIAASCINGEDIPAVTDIHLLSPVETYVNITYYC